MIVIKCIVVLEKKNSKKLCYIAVPIAESDDMSDERAIW